MLRTALGPTITEVRATPPNGIHGKDTADASVSHDEDELWSLKTVVARTGQSRSTIYSYIAQGIFPRQRRLGLRRVGWLALGVGQFRALPCAGVDLLI
jgi:prophage regulatory protein